MSVGPPLMFTAGLDTSAVDAELGRIPGKAQRAGQGMGRGLSVADVSIGKIVAGLGLAKAGLEAMSAVKGAVQLGGQFESLESRLATLLGSETAAKDRLAELFKLSSSTPFEIQGLVEADVQLEAFGANAERWRGPVMDLAGAMGMDLTDAASAVGRAFTGGAGAADILRERGVLAMLELRTGTKATNLSIDEFRAALYDTLTDPNGKIAGGTKRLAGTFGGLVSNLHDQWTSFQKGVADAGLFDASKAGAQELLNLLDDNRYLIVDIATTTGETLKTAFELGVYGAGKLYDGVALVGVGIQSWGAVSDAAFAKILGGIADAIDAVETFNAKIGDPLNLSEQLGGAWDYVATAANEAGRAADASARDLRRTMDEVGAGSERAQQIIAAMEGAGGSGGAPDAKRGGGGPTAAQVGAAGGPTEDQMQAEITFLTVVEDNLVTIIDLEAERAARLAEQRAELERQAQVADGLGGIFSTVYGIGISMADQMAATNKRGARVLYDSFRALGLAEIVFNTAAGLARAAAQPPPLNGIMTAQVLAGAAAATIKLATAKPPASHIGEGYVQAQGNLPGETQRTVLEGEGVINSTAVAMAGGKAAIDAMNQLQGNREQVYIVPTLGHRHFSAFASQHERIPGSVLYGVRRAAQSDPVGHSARAA